MCGGYRTGYGRELKKWVDDEASGAYEDASLSSSKRHHGQSSNGYRRAYRVGQFVQSNLEPNPNLVYSWEVTPFHIR